LSLRGILRWLQNAIALALSIGLIFSVGQPSSAVPAEVNLKTYVFKDCRTGTNVNAFEVCTSGRPNAKLRVAFMGDSHTRQYFPALFNLADKYNWLVTVISKSGCPTIGTNPFPKVADQRFCKEWNLSREAYLASVKPFDLIINSNSSFLTRGVPVIAAAFKQTIQLQLARGTKVVTIFDNPKPRPDILKCYQNSGDNSASQCAVSKKLAFASKDSLPKAIAGLPGVKILDFTSSYCGVNQSAPNECPTIIKGVKVYRDSSHITAAFASTLQGKIAAELPAFAKRR
jgi:hypothetical protein